MNRNEPANMTILVIAGMIDAKLKAKLQPIVSSSAVERIHLVRRTPFFSDKVVCHTPPVLAAHYLPLAELYRFFTIFYLAARHRPSVIIALGTIPHGIYAWVVGSVLRIPVIQHVKGNSDLRMDFPGQWGKGLALAALRSAAAIAVRGRRMAEFLAGIGISRDKIFIQHNLHDFGKFRAVVGKEPEYDLIYVGTFHKVKRLDILVEAMAGIQSKRPKTTLLMIGDGPERQKILKRTLELGLERNVHFQGSVPFDELPEWYLKAKVLVLTSQNEGLPMCMVEAMSCGLPVIVPSVGDIEDIAEDGKNAIVVPPLDKEVFIQAVLRVLNDKKLYASLKAGVLNIRNTHGSLFTLDHQVKVWTKFLTSS